ncbi:MAG: DMT family transporter [Planctomycetota bacterium]|nr:DMT family transporter [Planctomycetota bacterium]
MAAIAAIALWSTVATAFKLALRHTSPVMLLFMANIVSAIFFIAWSAVEGKLKVLLPATRRQWLTTCSMAVVSPFAYYLVLFRAYDLLPAQVAQPLNYTWAITLSVMSVLFLGKRLTGMEITGGLVAYAGVWLICSPGGHFEGGLSTEGIALALGSTLLWATFWILSTLDDRAETVTLGAAFVASLPLTAAAALMTGIERISWQAATCGIYVGLFEMGFTFVLWAKAMRWANSTAKISSLIFLSPFLSLVFIWLIVGEDIAWTSILGLVVIVVGLILQRLKNQRGIKTQ